MKKDPLVTAFSLFFISKYRVSILLLLAVLGLGFFSYSTLLRREGFPAVDVPIAIIEVPYFVGDTNRVDEEVTKPIERALSKTKNISEIRSTTNENSSRVVVRFPEGFSPEQGVRDMQEDIERLASLPEGASVTYRTINASSPDGTHDMILTISGNKTVQELEEKAAFVAEELEKSRGVVEANPLYLVNSFTTPGTGEEVARQVRFNRVGMRRESGVAFQPAIAIGVVKHSDLDALTISDTVREEIGKLQAAGNLDTFQVAYGGDIAPEVRDQIVSLEKSALSGLIALIAILLLTINLRASIITAIFMPTVMGAVFIALYVIGYSLNVVSLFALILVLGLLVDDAIVVVEAIEYQFKKGRKGLDAIRRAITDIGPADIMGTLTTLLVFAPMLFVSGLLGEFIRLIPVTVMLSLTLSLIIAVTFIPFLSRILLISRPKRTKGTWASMQEGFLYWGSLPSKSLDYLGEKTANAVHALLQKRSRITAVISTSIILIAGGLWFASQLSFSVFPSPEDTDTIMVSMEFVGSESVESSEARAIAVENALLETAGEYIEEVHYFFAAQEQALAGITLSPMNSRSVTSRAIVADLRENMETMEGVRLKIEQESAGPPASDYQFMTQIFADDIDTLTRAGNDLEAYLLDWQAENVRVTEVAVDNLTHLAKLDGKRYIEVKGKISEPENTAVIMSLREEVDTYYSDNKLAQLGLSADAVQFDLGQEGENIESFQSTILALAVAILFMYALLVFRFDSFLQPFMILLAVPLTFPGLFPGLFATNHPLSFFVMLGIIALSGIVVNNTIMLLDFANRARSRFQTSAETIVEALRARFRPIVVTSLTTIAGVIPLALTDPFWESLAYTIIFGLISSTILVVLVFPAYYVAFEKVRSVKKWVTRKFGVER